MPAVQNTMPGNIAANVVQALQTDPFYYRHFGPYWWAMKKALKGAGYTKRAFLGLGEEFPDPEALRRFDGTPDLLEKALAYQEDNARWRWHDPTQPDPDDDERPDYFLHDPDVES